MSIEESVPDGVIGRVGMLVALRRVKGMEDGRLGVVRNAVGWVKDLLGADRHVFAWQILLTGEPVVINGHKSQQVIVADACLLPVSQLAPGEVKNLLGQAEKNAIEDALAAVRGVLTPDEMASPQFERALHLASGTAMLKHAEEKVGVEAVLMEIGFLRSNPPDGEGYVWRSVLNGQEIRMSAAPGMFGEWRIWLNSANAREIFLDERTVLNDWPRGQVMQCVLEMWEGVLGRARIPRQLAVGWIFRQHKQDMRTLAVALPSVYADGDEFRMVLRWLREAYVAAPDFEGPPQDVPLNVTVQDGMLRLKTDRYDLGVAVLRGWLDPHVVSLRELLAIAPTRIRGGWVKWITDVDGASLGGIAVNYRKGRVQ